MYYFDSEYLQQYLDSKSDLKVFVDNEYYSVTDSSDIANPSFGVGYDGNGKPHTFDYRAIQQIKAAGAILTLDQLQTKVTGQEEPEGGAEAPPEDNLDMGADLESEPGAGEEAPPTEEEPEPPQEHARRIVGQMITEARKKKAKNTADTGFVVGDFVENVDLQCEYHGSRGIVTDVIMPDEKDGVADVEYKVYNYGYNFKPGKRVVKLANQLRKIP